MSLECITNGAGMIIIVLVLGIFFGQMIFLALVKWPDDIINYFKKKKKY